ncbi:hypothetical protein [Shewanella glacialimarina]|uniref:hypothetical protein n=1 Tax=Shewanella glacialimarina TaxID=2590884 RepID=UPI001CF8B192|nr:hypothetical protein [Shewanella glacialimarina]UCX06282.1 hypothetical protein FJ709_18330 [Shewanella glacialimarina]
MGGLSWITDNNKQLNWLEQYLDRKKIFFTYEGSLKKEDLTGCIERIEDPGIRLKFTLNMRAAWNKSQSRQRKLSDGFISQSMEIKKETQQQLKALALSNSCSQSEIISCLIKKDFDATALLKKELKECASKLSVANRQIKKLKSSRLTNKIPNIEAAEKHILTLEELVLNQRRTLSDNTIAMKDLKLENNRLTSQQKKEAKELYNKAKDKLYADGKIQLFGIKKTTQLSQKIGG